jgi:arsenical pump membrane protein
VGISFPGELWRVAVEPGLAVAVPLTCFLTAVLWLSAESTRTGLHDRAAWELARFARGSRTRLFAGVCAAAALLTCTLSLDGAVVVLVPALVILRRRFDAPIRPLLLATIGVTNAFSMATPQGNPTNLIAINSLGISSIDFTRTMALPGLLATLLCVAVVARAERPRLTGTVALASAMAPPADLGTLGLLALTVVAEVAAPFVGIAGWWPPCLAALLGLALRARTAPLQVPWRIGGIIALVTGSLAALTHAAGISRLDVAGSTTAMVAVALLAGGIATIVNNLPAGAVLSRLLPAPAVFASLIGLSVGAVAGRRGSVATILTFRMAGGDGRPAERGYGRLWAPTAFAATIAAAVAVQMTAR